MHLLMAAGVVVMLVFASYGVAVLFDDKDRRAAGLQETPEFEDATFRFDQYGLVDTDGDGLSDAQENFVYGTNATNPFTSGSRIPDGWLARYGQDLFDTGIEDRPAARPPKESLPAAYNGQWPSRFTSTLMEIYSFGKPEDWSEANDGAFFNGIDPRKWDNNDDGIPDGFVLAHGLDPFDDEVGARILVEGAFSVEEAYLYGVDPRTADTDGDGISDRDEIAGPVSGIDPSIRFEPTDPLAWDTAGTGVCDGYLVRFGLDPHSRESALGDPDLDGATTKEEFEWSRARAGDSVCSTAPALDPLARSTVEGSIPDGWLIRYGLDALDPDLESQVTQRASEDPGSSEADTSGLEDVILTVGDEYRVNRPHDWDEAVQGPWWGGTDPTLEDTDGDGLGDAWEIRGYRIHVSTGVGPSAERVVYHTSSDPTRVDTDGDGLADGIEARPIAGSHDPPRFLDARRPDTDFDGILDGDEVLNDLGLDPTTADTAGDFLRDGQRLKLLEDRVEQYQQSLAYEFPGEPGVPRRVTDWIGHLSGAGPAHNSNDPATVASVFGPKQDIDGDGIINILDDDMDGDGLKNGWEVEPRHYGRSPFGIGVFSQGRSPTDFLNPDTDGDGLRDGWEVRFGVPDSTVGGYNLDPSRWDSDGNGIGDGDEDPDEPATVWISFKETADGFAPDQTHEERFTNRMEQDAGTDPNRMDSDEDGLRDGWKVFWGSLYPALSPGELGAVYPGASQGSSTVALQPEWTVPKSGTNQLGADPLATVEYIRFALTGSPLLPGEDEIGVTPIKIHPSGETFDVARISGARPFTLHDAQALGTNPLMAQDPLSTDGDGMPDAWEWLHQETPPGTITEAGTDVGLCQEGNLDPLLYDPDGDADQDGLSNLEEYLLGTNPLCQDSDLDGINDYDEVRTHDGLDPMDPSDGKLILQADKDSDLDGVTDFDELVNLKTDPNNPDTDGDGLLDGPDLPSGAKQCSDGLTLANDQSLVTLFLGLGIAHETCSSGGERYFFFLGEQSRNLDPVNADDSGSGIPSGWLAAYGLAIAPSSSAFKDHYNLNRPGWWDEARHGPWWGGASPKSPLPSNPDMDKDGLIDFRSGRGFEDPMPAVNQDNAWRSFDFQAYGLEGVHEDSHPDDPDLSPMEARIRAQMFINPVGVVPHPLSPGDFSPPPADRQTPCLDDVQFPAEVELGGQAIVTGIVNDCATDDPFSGITVEAFLPGVTLPLGVGFSGEDGAFEIPLDLHDDHGVQVPSHAVFLGQQGGSVQWSTDTSKVPLGTDHSLVLRTYATPIGHPGAPSGGLHSGQAEKGPVAITTSSLLTLEAPDELTAGRDLTVAVRLTDGALHPRQDPVTVSIAGTDQTKTPALDGRATFTFTDLPLDWVGEKEVVAHSTPSGPDADWVEGGAADSFVQVRQLIRLEPAVQEISADAGDSVLVEGGLVPDGPRFSTYGEIHLSVNFGNDDQVIPVTLGSGGRYAGVVPIPQNATSGTYTVIHRVAETASTQGDQTSNLLKIRGTPWFSGVRLDAIDVGATASVAGRLIQTDGSPVGDASVSVRLGDNEETVITKSDGTFEASLAAGTVRRPLVQEITFAGDAANTAARHHAERLVRSAASMEFVPGEVEPGATAHVAASLHDSAGAPVVSAPVQFHWNDLGNRSALTNETGVAVAAFPVPADMPLGRFDVVGAYYGSQDGTVGPAAGATTWHVLRHVEFHLPDPVMDAGAAIPSGRLMTTGGEPVVGAKLVIDNGTDAYEVTTDEDGRFRLLAAAVPPDARPASIALNISYDGGGIHEPAATSMVLSVRARTSVEGSIPPLVTIGRESLTSIHVQDLQGKPVSEGEVLVLLGDQAVGSASLRNGVAKVSYEVPLGTREGPVSLRLQYGGSSQYAPSGLEKDAILTVTAELTITTAGQVGPGEYAQVKVQAMRNGRPLTFSDVFLVVDGYPSGLQGTTDETGSVVFDVRQANHTMRIAARYDGDAVTSAVVQHGSMTPVGQAAGSGLLAWVITGLAVVALLVGGAMVLYRRRVSPLADAFRAARRTVTSRKGPPKERILGAYQHLEDAAMGAALLDAPAVTPGVLAEAVAFVLPAGTQRLLDELVQIFEYVRYGEGTVEPQHADHVGRILTQIIRHMMRSAAWAEPLRGETPA